MLMLSFLHLESTRSLPYTYTQVTWLSIMHAIPLPSVNSIPTQPFHFLLLPASPHSSSCYQHPHTASPLPSVNCIPTHPHTFAHITWLGVSSTFHSSMSLSSLRSGVLVLVSWLWPVLSSSVDKRFPDSSRVEFVFSPPLVNVKSKKSALFFSFSWQFLCLLIEGETIQRALKRNSGEMMEDLGVKDTSSVGSFTNEVGQERTQPDGENSQGSPSSE